MRAELERRGYALDTTTRAMGMALDEIAMPPPQLDLAAAEWSEYLALADLPPGFLSAADHAAFHLQSTPVAEHVYAAVGFRDLGRILEYVPRAA